MRLPPVPSGDTPEEGARFRAIVKSVSAPRTSPEGGTVFYDGSCGLCHRAVKRLIAMDTAGVLRFAPLGGETFLARFDEGARRTLPDSLVYESPGGEVLTRSDALVGALLRLGPGARLLGRLLALV